ncbi:lipoprotein insertase outer membrane protein LolB [Alteromonas sp. ASW11-130]|uniref:lipoprotein insertase outer membrane protein LolB n=1 Tax=Alteromonas sp. ASW11-130 TaxID=3015775 RepID=UPI002241E110|nr:lipoprotein insertase outer membrane protein LolB [Alteromonas sp. ASW11-130]MCW8090673.1 lipoprotein insertase outer membrane protein LolB [Alteromonas sp. ASW11-130]
MIRLFRYLFFVALLSLSLYGCSTLPDGPKEDVNLPKQVATLKTMKAWQLKGKMAIRNHKEAISATVKWDVERDNFYFTLTNFLGITLVDMVAKPGLATLKANDEEYSHHDASELIAQVTGWDIPLADLLAWIKGLPKASDTYTLSEHGLLETLSPACSRCQNWRIAYDNYDKINNVWLPHSLVMTRANDPKQFIKIRISEWTIN